MTDHDLASTPEEPLTLWERWRRPTSELTSNEMTRRWILRSSIAVVISLGLFAALIFVTESSDDDDAEVVAVARLVWNPERDDPLGEGKAASAEVVVDDGERRVFVFDIEVLRPTADAEFVEVWLVANGEEAEYLSVGAFDEIRTRLFTLPDGVDPLDYDVVMLSLERDDGDPGFSGRSLIHGDLVVLVDPPSSDTGA